MVARDRWMSCLDLLSLGSFGRNPVEGEHMVQSFERACIREYSITCASEKAPSILLQETIPT